MNQEEREVWFRYIRLSEDGKARLRTRLGLVGEERWRKLEQAVMDTLAIVLGVDIPSSEGVEDE